MIQIDNIFDERTAERELFLETQYTGNNPTLRGKQGEAYLRVVDDQWYFKPFDFNFEEEDENWFRVKEQNLECNHENGWIKCDYIGVNTAAGKTGKAYFDTLQNVWIYKPHGTQEEFRIPNEKSLVFLRDKDVI